MKHKIVTSLLITATLLVSYLIATQGTWSTPNPPLWDIVFLTAVIAVLLSVITVIPYYIFVVRGQHDKKENQ